MKKIFTLSVAALLSLSVLDSCSHSSGSSSGGTMTCTINGASFNGTKCMAVKSTSGSTTIMTLEGAPTNLTALSSTDPLLTLSLYSYTGIGTYTFGGSASNSGTIDSNVSTTALANTTALSGTVNITATSPNVVGTFSFTTVDGTNVTGGSFNIAP